MSDDSEEPKLIIDEDWKSQVERERAELQSNQDNESDNESDSGSTTQESAADSELPPPPPATFSFLVTTLASQAMASLGQIPGDDENPMPVNLDYARHFIDLIGTLEEKTKGNLDEEETQYLDQTLHQMRMMYVAVKQQAGS